MPKQHNLKFSGKFIFVSDITRTRRVKHLPRTVKAQDSKKTCLYTTCIYPQHAMLSEKQSVHTFASQLLCRLRILTLKVAVTGNKINLDDPAFWPAIGKFANAPNKLIRSLRS